METTGGIVELAVVSIYDQTMKARLYLETTIPSYLTAWPSRDLVRAAHQQITRDWWDKRRTRFEIYISQVVLRECQAGDVTAAAERLRALQDLPLLEQTEAATRLAQSLLSEVPLSERAAVDALHVAIAAVHGMDYLLTWNCTHIANATCKSQSSRFAVQMVMSRQRFAHRMSCWPRKEIERGRYPSRVANGSRELRETIRV